jgi:hypothetical protein
MVSNDLIMPILLRGRRLALSDLTMASFILQIRRLAIIAFMLLAYLCYRMIGDAFTLASPAPSTPSTRPTC